MVSFNYHSASLILTQLFLNWITKMEEWENHHPNHITTRASRYPHKLVWSLLTQKLFLGHKEAGGWTVDCCFRKYHISVTFHWHKYKTLISAWDAMWLAFLFQVSCECYLSDRIWFVSRILAAREFGRCHC